MSLPSKRELVIIGAGGFGAVAARLAENMNGHNAAVPWEVIGFADCDSRKRGTLHDGRMVHGTVEDLDQKLSGHDLWFFCAIGDNGARAQMARSAERLGWKAASLVHPSAIVDSSVEIGSGSCIGPVSVISFNTRIGAHVLVDMHASIGHDAVLMDFCEVFPGARISGNCRLGEYAIVGSNATLLPGTQVGDRAVVGANSLAHGRVEPDATIFGVPARTILNGTNSHSQFVNKSTQHGGGYGQYGSVEHDGSTR